MIVDIHLHNMAGLEELITSARQNGITKLCLSTINAAHLHTPSPAEIRRCNNDTLKAMAQYPDQVIGFCYLNPRHGNSCIKELKRCLKAGMRGIKLWIACRASNREIFPIAREAIRQEVPILQHAWIKTTGNYPNESVPADVAVLARRFPKLKIIMAHLCGIKKEGVQCVKACKNVMIDTSGGNPCNGVMEYAIKHFGARRILYGSDAPVRSFGSQLSKVFGAAISESARRRILWKNSAELLRL